MKMKKKNTTTRHTRRVKADPVTTETPRSRARSSVRAPGPTTVVHTQGPWHTGANGDHCAKGHAICSGPYVIAKVYGHGYDHSWSPQSQADANLLAAAPELLDALRDVTDCLNSYKTAKGSELMSRARAAIAKAEGR